MVKLFFKHLISYKHSPAYCYIGKVKCKKGLTGLVVAAAGTIGGGAIAASGAKKAAETQAESQREALRVQEEAAKQEAIKRGEAVDLQKTAGAERKKALEGIKLPTILETDIGQQLKGTLQDRLAGRGISQIDVQGGTAPFRAERLAGLKREEASIGAAASSRGLGRSTIPVSQIAEAGKGASRDISSTAADLQRQNKVLEAQQTVDALSRFQALTNRELDDQQRGQLFEAEKVLAEESGQINVANTIAGNATIEKQNQFSIANSIASIGATEAAGQLQQAALIGSGILEAGLGLGNSIGQSNSDIVTAIEASEKDRGIGAIVLRGQNPGEFEQRRLSILNK